MHEHQDADADRRFLRDVLGFRGVDAGDGWLILALPPAEIAVHPSSGNFVQRHAEHHLLGAVLSLMCDDLRSSIKSLAGKDVTATQVEQAEWGLKTTIRLPSGGEIGLYQPTHPTALPGNVPVREPSQSLGEEVANSVSHGVGLLAALFAVPVLVRAAVRRGSVAGIIGASVFAATIVLLYLASTLYHALPRSKAKRVFRVLDYGAVFLLIAGTYTPFTLGVLHGAWGWTLFGLVWSLAGLGIVLTAVGGVRYPRLSTAVYLGMGWLVLIAIRPLWLRVPVAGLVWLLAGGIAYTVGVGFLTAKRMRYSHFFWHLLVLAGTSCHFIAVFSYAA